MKCPYIAQSETHISALFQNSSSEEEKIYSLCVDSWGYQMQECLKEDCAAWKNGECCYTKP